MSPELRDLYESACIKIEKDYNYCLCDIYGLGLVLYNAGSLTTSNYFKEN